MLPFCRKLARGNFPFWNPIGKEKFILCWLWSKVHTHIFKTWALKILLLSIHSVGRYSCISVVKHKLQYFFYKGPYINGKAFKSSVYFTVRLYHSNTKSSIKTMVSCAGHTNFPRLPLPFCLQELRVRSCKADSKWLETYQTD